MSYTGPHNYKIEYFEPGVEKGTCRGCGTVKYFPTSPGKSTLNRVNKLNEQAGVITNFKRSDFHRDNTKQREELKMKNENTTQAQELPPVPPRPDTTGMNKGEVRMAMHAYYTSNKEAILATVKLIGSTATRKHWGIPGSTWVFLRKRWGIPNERKRRIESPADVPGTPGREKKSEEPEKVEEKQEGETKTAPVEEADRYISLGTFEVIEDNGLLPAFPSFDKDWPMLVQIEWFRTYRELAGVK